MEHPLSRTEILLGKKALEKLSAARVAVIGLGGVGSAAAEALARGGIGTLILADSDTVSYSNLNRQLAATMSFMGMPKTQAMAARIADAAPSCKTQGRELFLLPQNIPEFLDEIRPDYLLDAIDTVSSKISLAVECARRSIPIISCMGAGNKLDPTRFMVADIFETSVCPLCRVMRRELKSRGVAGLKVVYSDEQPLSPHPDAPPPSSADTKRPVPGSVSFVPPVAGIIAAGEVIKDIARLI
ncbi:MAG: tRNA threonylcarbamoyladenosine dehydratase [Clostridiales bacterium]|nr:tRNA threonylcarbamoyladenosine dehydratase [Clostridiales bacterium]